MAILGLGNTSITKKLTWMNMSVSAGALLLACAAFISYDVLSFRETRQLNLSIRAQMVGANSAAALLFNDPQSAEHTLASLGADPHVISAGIYTKAGELFAGYLRDKDSPALPPHIAGEDRIDFDWLSQGQVTAIGPILIDGKHAGAVYILSSLEDLNIRLKRFAEIVVLILVASLTAAFLFSSMLRTTIAQPIVGLAETARIVTREKKYSVRADPTRNRDEMSDLIEAFNEMLGQIQERDAELQKARDELEQKVQQRTAELRASNKELEAFSYSVSHDLRAPLRHIDGFSKLLVETHNAELSDEAREYIALIRDSTREMGQLVDDLLNLARVGRQELAMQVTGLNSVVDEVMADLKAVDSRRAIDWKLQKLPFVECDPGLLKQVFGNLLSNAIKFTRTREKAVIEVGVSVDDGSRAIFVRDNGVGFNMKSATKLFGVFQRLHRQEDFEGTGVGLATVQRIINKHGGRIWAEAELNQGATFYFTLGNSDKTISKNDAPAGGQS